MKIGQTVWVPELRMHGRIHELSWDAKRIKSVQVFEPGTDIPKIINVVNMIVEAVTLVEAIIIDIISFFRKPKRNDRTGAKANSRD